MKTGLWHHNYKLDPHDSFGFCYLIKNTINGKGYIGKKQYYSYKKKKKHKEADPHRKERKGEERKGTNG